MLFTLKGPNILKDQVMYMTMTHNCMFLTKNIYHYFHQD